VVRNCLHVFAKSVVDLYLTNVDHEAHEFLSKIVQYRDGSCLESVVSVDVAIETLVWIMYESSFGHSVQHIAPIDSMSEQWRHQIQYGTPFESDIIDMFAFNITTPESMCSLYPLHMDTLGTFRLGVPCDVLQREISLWLEPYIRQTLGAPKTIICCHGH
jgi:hypothetical protein